MPEETTPSRTVLVLGVGPMPPEKPERLHAPGLRLWSLARFLAGQGHNVIIGMVGFAGHDEDMISTAGKGRDESLVAEDLPHGIIGYRLPYGVETAARGVRAIAERHHPRCVVSTADFMNLVAVSACLPVPVWADLLGQPMAERQLLCDVYGSDEGLRGQWEYVLPVLLGADHFSVCSARQRCMMLGELGAVGRLNRHTAHGNLVDVLLPNHLAGEEFRHERNVLRGVCLRADDFVALWSGGYNTWTDVETLFQGLERAMAQHPRVVFVSIGGEIAGHDDQTYKRFREMVGSSRFKHRYELCGWVRPEECPNYYLESNVALNIDRWSIEGEVGYRTRLLDWIMAGLPVVTTVLCELTEDLAARNYVTPFRIGDPKDLGIKLAALAVDCSIAMERTAKAREYLRATLAPEAAWASLAAWAADPRPAPDLPPLAMRPKLPLRCPENSLARLHRGTLPSQAQEKRFWARLFGRAG